MCSFFNHLSIILESRQCCKYTIRLSCKETNFFNQYPWMLSGPDAFQFRIFLSTFIILRFVITILSWSLCSSKLSCSKFCSEAVESLITTLDSLLNYLPFLIQLLFLFNIKYCSFLPNCVHSLSIFHYFRFTSVIKFHHNSIYFLRLLFTSTSFRGSTVTARPTLLLG